MRIELWSDIACPHCYVTHEHLYQAVAHLSFRQHIKIIHRSYQLNPHAPVTQSMNAYENLSQKRGISIHEARKNYDELCLKIHEISGMHYRYDIMQLTNTMMAHRLAKWARLFHKEREVHSRFYRAFFIEGKHLGSIETLVEIMAEIGFDPQEVRCFLSTSQLQDLVKAEHSEAKFERQVRGVPYLLINGKYEIYGALSVAELQSKLRSIWNEEQQPNVFADASIGECCEDEECTKT